MNVTHSIQVPTPEQQIASRNAIARMVESHVSTAATKLDMPGMIEYLAELDPSFPVADYHDALAKLRALSTALQPL